MMGKRGVRDLGRNMQGSDPGAHPRNISWVRRKARTGGGDGH